jgi:hypothetical protein
LINNHNKKRASITLIHNNDSSNKNKLYITVFVVCHLTQHSNLLFLLHL